MTASTDDSGGWLVTPMIDATLLTESRRLLDRARMIAEAPAAQVTQVGGRGHPSSAPPPGLRFFASGRVTHEPSTLEHFGALMNAAIARGSESGLRRVNQACAAELSSLQHSPARSGAETRIEFAARVCANYEGVLAGVVARAEMTSVTTVRKIRSDGQRDARTGHKLT